MNIEEKIKQEIDELTADQQRLEKPEESPTYRDYFIIRISTLNDVLAWIDDIKNLNA